MIRYNPIHLPHLPGLLQHRKDILFASLLRGENLPLQMNFLVCVAPPFASGQLPSNPFNDGKDRIYQEYFRFIYRCACVPSIEQY